MRSDELEIVCFALALHLKIDPDAIREEDHLEEGLGLDPLDLVLVALRLEELGEGEFPVQELENVHTVRELADAVRAWNDGPATVRCGMPVGMELQFAS